MAASADLAITLSVRMGRMEAELAKATSSLRAAERQAKQTATSMAGVGPSFALATRGIEAGARGITTAIGSVVRVVGTMTAAFATIGVGVGIGNALSSIASLADEAGSLGMTANELLAVRQGFEEAGGSATQATAGLQRFAAAMGEAASGNREAQQTMFDLAVSYRNADGSVRTTTQGFEDLIAKINSADSLQEKLALASTAVGVRNARTFVAAIEEMGGSVAAGEARLRAMGQALDENTAPAIDRLGTVFANLGRTISVAIGNAVAQSEPQIRQLIENITGWVLQAINAINGIAANWRISSAQAADTGLQALEQQARPVVAELTRLRGNLTAIDRQISDLEARGGRRSVLGAALGTEQTGTELARLRGEAVGLLEAAQRAGGPLLRQLEARRGIVADIARINLPADVDRGRGNAPITPENRRVAPVAPPARGGGGTRETEAQREANRLLSDSYRDLTKIMESAADPQIQMQAALGDVTRAIREQDRAFEAYQQAYGRLPADIAPLTISFETLASVAEKAAEDVAKAMQGTGASASEITAAITRNVTAFAEELARTGRITTDQIGAIVAAAQTAGQRVTRTGFVAGLQTGAGVDPEKAAPDFVTELGKGVGQISTGVFDQLSASLDKVASGAVSAGDAIKEFALDFVKSVAQMVAKAAALALLNVLLRSLSGGGTAAPAVPVPGASTFGGFRAGGGTARQGVSYWVGEQGPELFTPYASGRITPNGAAAPMAVTIVNNAPGVVVEQTRSDDETVAVAVRLSRQRVASDFGESARTGFGAYAETLSSRYAMRRRL